MTIELPKALKTYQYRPLTVFSLLDVDTDRVLPQLFEMCVKGGRVSTSRTRADDFEGYRDAMLASGNVTGFDNELDKLLLDGWLRSCVVDMGTQGRSRSGEQMLAVAPLTLATYRAGLPKERTRHRGVDDVVYRLLLAEFEGRGANASSGPESARAQLRELVTSTIGRGLEIGPQPRWEPQLVDPERLDIGALLAYRFVEGFEMAGAREVSTTSPDSPLPDVAADLGSLLLSHLRAYGDRLPVPALTAGFAALLAFGVFAYSLRTDIAARTLLRTGEASGDLLPGQGRVSPLELYCDFTGDVGSESDRMSRRCVERDLDRVRLAFRDRMTFVMVEQAMARIPDEAARHEALSHSERIAHLAALRSHRKVESWAETRLDSIIEESPEATEPEREFLRRIQGDDIPELDKVLTVLEEVNSTRAVANAVNWFSSVGAKEKPYGIIRGAAQRRTWRYAPGDELLTALLLAVFVEPDGVTTRAEMPLRAVLDALRTRFGILVDRPPAFLDGAEARTAASANLEAFTLRLQLLGCFDNLSDDFSVQVVHHPLGDD